MYRIELRPGEETALRTIDELATGIRNGVITSRARIWHNAGQKWLPIEFHPHYKAALQQLEAGTADESEQVAGAAAVALAPAPAPVEPEPAAPAPVSAVRPVASRSRAFLRPIGLLAVGSLVIAGAKLATSTPVFGTASAEIDSGAAVGAPRAPAPAPDAPETPMPAATAVRESMPPSTEPTAAPATTVTSLATQRTIAGGGVVRGPLQAPEPAPAVPPVAKQTVDTIPSAPPMPALDLTLPSTLPSVHKPTVRAPTAAAPSADSVAR